MGFFGLTTAKGFIEKKRTETGDQGFLIYGEDYIMDNQNQADYMAAIVFSVLCALFLPVFIMIFTPIAKFGSKFDEIGVKVLMSIFTAVLFVIMIQLWRTAIKQKKRFKQIKETAKESTAIIKRFFIYTLNISKRQQQMNQYSFEFQLENDAAIYTASHHFASGTNPWGIKLPIFKKCNSLDKIINNDIFTYDETKKHYYIDAGNKQVPVLVSCDKKIIFLNVMPIVPIKGKKQKADTN